MFKDDQSINGQDFNCGTLATQMTTLPIVSTLAKLHNQCDNLKTERFEINVNLIKAVN